MNDTLNEVIQELADLSYTALDLKEDITTGEPSIQTALEKINKIHQVLIFNQDKLIELTNGTWIDRGGSMKNLIYPNDSWGTFNAESEYKNTNGIHPSGTIDINLFTDDQTGEKFLSLYPVDDNGQTDCTKSLGFYKLQEVKL